MVKYNNAIINTFLINDDAELDTLREGLHWNITHYRECMRLFGTDYDFGLCLHAFLLAGLGIEWRVII